MKRLNNIKKKMFSLNLMAIRWELIIAFMLGFTTIVSYSIIQTGDCDWRDYVLALCTLIPFILWIIKYNDFKKARLLLKDIW